MFNIMKLKGSVTIPLAVAISGSLVVVGWISQYYVQVNAQDAKVAEVRQTTAVLENRVGTIEKQFERIEEKIDDLLWANGINPNQKTP